MAEFKEVLGLKDLLQIPARKLSLGQKMRCELAASLIHGPKIVFLDEPTIGLDVAVKQSIREFVRKINRERGVTMILTTHDLRDIEELCSRVLIIDKGRIVFDGTLDALRAQAADAVELVFTMKHELPRDWQPDGLPRDGITWKAEGAGLSALLSKTAMQRTEVIRAVLDKFGHEVGDIAINEPQIEHIVRRIYAAGAADPRA
jgi:ABC-2 type transport system ATP-binding protein